MTFFFLYVLEFDEPVSTTKVCRGGSAAIRRAHCNGMLNRKSYAKILVPYKWFMLLQERELSDLRRQIDDLVEERER